jgi:hypothetical protein
MGGYRKRLPFQAIAEEFSVSAFKQTADRRAQRQKPWCDLLVQPLLVVHRG